MVSFYKLKIKSIFVCISLFTIVLVGLSLCLPAFSVWRANASYKEIVLHVMKSGIIKTDARGPMIPIVVEFHKSEDSIEYGKSLFTHLSVCIPRVIWKTRPRCLDEKFASENMQNWRRGLGMGYSLTAEGFRNGGYFGVFIFYFIFGIFLSGSLMIIDRFCQNQAFTWAYLSALCPLMCVMIHRNTSAFMVHFFIYVLLFYCFCYLIFDVNCSSEDNTNSTHLIDVT
jgi:hypothetical protein